MKRTSNSTLRQRNAFERYCRKCGTQLDIEYKGDEFDDISGERLYYVFGTCPVKEPLWERLTAYIHHAKKIYITKRSMEEIRGMEKKYNEK